VRTRINEITSVLFFKGDSPIFVDPRRPPLRGGVRMVPKKLGQSPAPAQKKGQFSRAGFTLLEVILSLALSAVLLFAVALAVDLNLRLLDSRRTEVEEDQLARAVLQIMARDISNAVYLNSSDVENLMANAPMASVNKNEQIVQSSGQSGQGGQSDQGGGQSGQGGQSDQGGGQSGQGGQSNQGGGQSGQGGQSNQGGGQSGQGGQGGQGSGQSGKGGQSGQGSGQSSQGSQSSTGGQNSSAQNSSTGQNTTQTTNQSTSSTEDTEDTETDRTSELADAGPQTQPGLFGNAYQLLIDVSQAPRPDQSRAFQENYNNSTADLLSDTKTVAYYVTAEGAAQSSAAGNALTANRGLVRRQMDRASALYAAEQGGQINTTDGNTEPFAPEVEAVQFRYYDGSQWLDQWDSISEGGLPQAVEISLAVTRQHPRYTQNSQALTYHLLVKLPTAKSTSTETSSTQSSSTQTTSTTSQ
jgi:prepilin-type N-terminal cleavage/methylation domain-containing protein